ncbi:MAG: GDP-mannose 4,6-dehydratase [Candidatus Niyogibacteria bacterium]|nr:GDP-mannose 4,6-dehydratase [Candidatus Niyogibacteria bacterium]
MPTALITGITGQDGSYMADLLLSKNYRVIGMVRRSSRERHENIAHLEGKIELCSGDLSDQGSLIRALEKREVDELYNFAAQSFVGESWNQPVFTGDVTGLGALRVLEAIRMVNRKIKFYQASSSEMFGAVEETPQTEKTRFYPRSPYGFAKLYAHWATVNYREAHDIFAVSGILFNHESPRRGLEFVTRKITRTLARIAQGDGIQLHLGNLDARRDWGFAGDYVDAAWRMLQRPQPTDYVIASGVQHSVREFVEEAARCVGMDIAWQGTGADERGIDVKTGWPMVVVDPAHFRPAEVDMLCGNSAYARAVLDWKPAVSFEHLVRMMVDADLERLKKR